MVKDGGDKKLRILAAADLHGSSSIAEKLAEKAEKNKVDLVVLAGDIHGMFEGERVIEPFKKRHQKVIFVPGNWDTSLEVSMLKDIHKIKNIDGYYVNYNGVDIIGVGNPDFDLSLENKKIFDKIKKNFDRIRAKDNRKILVSHMHAKGTKAEFSGIKGSKILREAIERFKPDVFISAHIHEAEGIEEKIGKTKVVQVGRSGKVIEI